METADRVAVVVGLVIVFVLGLFDDVRGSGAIVRLAVEAAVGAAFALAVTGDLEPHLRISAMAVAVVAVPVAMNATNLVDNADGLAASLSLVTAGTLAAVGSINGLSSSSAPLALVTGVACVGFLAYNRPPARIFMGDSGSLTLGFALAAASVLLVRDTLLVPGTLHVAAAMAVPVAWALQAGDLVMVTITRMRRGASPFAGGVDHTSHRLLAAGVTPMVLLLALGAFAAFVGAAAAAAAAFFGGFALMALAAVSLLLLVAAFEWLVASRLPILSARNLDDSDPRREHSPVGLGLKRDG
jgi:UDP-GlcNAc:undecaprenyl-phosphate GlcNAc-1-phosphate transferase